MKILGIVGRWKQQAHDPQQLGRQLGRNSRWFLEQLPPPASMKRGGAYPAAVQWTDAEARETCIRVGDASLSRDILASQGLATGVSDALYAAAVHTENDAALLRIRQQHQRTAHLAVLAHDLANCRYGDAESWSMYRAFLDGHLGERRSSPEIGLVHGRLVSAQRPMPLVNP